MCAERGVKPGASAELQLSRPRDLETRVLASHCTWGRGWGVGTGIYFFQ